MRYKICIPFRYGSTGHDKLWPAAKYLLNELKNRDIACDYLPVKKQTGNKLFDYILWLYQLVQSGMQLSKYDCLFVDETLPFMLQCCRMRYSGGYVMTVADSFLDAYFGGISNIISNKLSKFELSTYKRANAFITKTNSCKEALIKTGISPNTIYVVNDACDFSVYNSLGEYKRHEHYFSIITHGIMHPNKGLSTLLMASKSLSYRIPRLKLILVGDGPDRKNLELLCRQFNINNVEFKGWLPTNNDVANALRSSDVGVAIRSGRNSDNWHITGALVHGMACGIPMVASDLLGIKEVIIDGVNGCLFKTGNQKDLEDCILKLYNNIGFSKSVARNGYETAKQMFDPNLAATKVADILEDVCRKRLQ